MKKLILILTIVLLTFGGCRALTKRGRSVNKAEKLYESGDYYSSVEELSNTLITNPEYKPAIELINIAFPIGIAKEEKLVKELKVSEDYLAFAKSNERVLNLYKFISRFQPTTQQYLDFKIDYNDLKYWTKETSKAYYQAGESFVNPKELEDFKLIAKLYKKSYTYNPKYKDNLEKYQRHKELAMQNLLLLPINYQYDYFDLGKVIDDNLFSKLMSNYEAIEFTNIIREEKLEHNRILTVKIASIEYSPPTIDRNIYTEYWYEVYRKTSNGGVKIEQLEYEPGGEYLRYVKHSYTRIYNVKNTSAKMNIIYELSNSINGRIIKTGTIEKEIFDSTSWNTYWGNYYSFVDFGVEGNVSDKFTLLKKLGIEASDELAITLGNILK